MIHTKLYRGAIDYSKHILQGDQKTDDLTDVLDVVNLTLVGLTRAEEFEPTTKFVYEKWYDVYDDDGNATQVLWKSWDIMVAEDLVEQPIISDNTYFNHQITFYEASVVAQGRIVDNIATTYKLKDISLDTDVLVDTKKTIEPIYQTFDTLLPATSQTKLFYWDLTFGRRFRWVFPDWFEGAYATYNASESDWTDLPYYIGVNTDSGAEGITTLTIPIPMLEIQKCIQGTYDFTHEGFCSVFVEVEAIDNLTGIKDDTISTSFSINPCDATISPYESEWNYEEYPYHIYANSSHARGTICSNIVAESSESGGTLYEANVYFSKVVEQYDYAINPKRNYTLSIADGTLKANYIYRIKLSLRTFYTDRHNFSVVKTHNASLRPMYYYQEETNQYQACYSSNSIHKPFWYGNNDIMATPDTLFASLEFVTYDANHNKEIFTAQAPAESAYALFVKAQLCSQNYEKVEGTPITSLSNLPFYLSAEDEQLLKNTQVVENFYNQKNLWEIFIEIGKYIHAIPRIEFGDSYGESGRYLVTFDKLGKTEQFKDNAMPISILNSKNIENYISACSSYVSNLVQLGGVIDEWVAPKSSSEDYLVYNDVAEIITSKPIIEIVGMWAKCTTDRYNFTDEHGTVIDFKDEVYDLLDGNGFVFEQNIYQLFSINHNNTLNKGIAIWYGLGSNKIQGLNYRLPVVNTGDIWGDYAIKRILRQVMFGSPDFAVSGQVNPVEIMVNDFIFHIQYRTKDVARSNQTRPDLRKYMLNTHLDKVPQHNQFNNQQDILVDSVKFGNNIYGKLIRTGNSEFTVTEWVQDLGQLKQIGQLYNIRGNIYYVAKVNNTFFADHITSVITYSKDYNQLSEIIGIPSEPRFYEISEQNLITREFCIDDYLLLTTKEPNPTDNYWRNYPFTLYATDNGWDYIKNLLFGSQTQFPKYAVTVFKNDYDNTYGQVAGNNTYFKEVCSVINTYSMKNTLTMEWDMVDNFSAGDKVYTTNASPYGTADSSYNTLEPVRYADIYGRADLLDFFIFDNIDFSNEKVYLLPESPLSSLNIIETSTLTEFVGYPTKAQLNTLVANNTNPSRQPQDGDGLYVAVQYIQNSNTFYRIVFYRFCDDDWISKTLFSGIQKVGNKFPDYILNSIAEPIKNYTNNLLFSNETLDTMGNNRHGLALMKDNREAISVNYNLQMLTDSDRFVLSSWLWQQNKPSNSIVFAFLNQEINKLSNDTIPNSSIISTYNVSNYISRYTDFDVNRISISVNQLIRTAGMQERVESGEVKALAIICLETFTSNVITDTKNFIIGRNISDLSNNDKMEDWYICGLNKRIFE